MFSTKEGRVESIETVPDTENDPINNTSVKIYRAKS